MAACFENNHQDIDSFNSSFSATLTDEFPNIALFSLFVGKLYRNRDEETFFISGELIYERKVTGNIVYSVFCSFKHSAMS